MRKSSDIHDVLQSAAAAPRHGPDVNRALLRASVLRWRRRVVLTVVCIAAGLGTLVSASAIVRLNETGRRTLPIGEPPSTLNLNTARVENIELGGAPTDVVVGGGSVWVVNSDGRGGRVITRLDQVTGEIIDEVRIDDFLDDYIDVDIDYSADRLWVVTAGSSNTPSFVLQFDSQGQHIGDPKQLAFTPGSISADASGVWITESNGGLAHFDAETGETSPVSAVSAEEVLASAGEVWAARPVEGLVWSINPSSGKVVDTIDVGPNPVGLEIDDKYLWVLIQLPEGDLQLTRIDRATRTIQGDPLVFGSGTGSGDLAIGDGAVWVPLAGQSTEGGPGQVVAISPDTNQIIGEPIVVGSGPTGVVADDRAVWTTNFNDSTVSRISLEE